eukprot:365381-Chlamydomonas_euryale.AAC.35
MWSKRRVRLSYLAPRSTQGGWTIIPTSSTTSCTAINAIAEAHQQAGAACRAAESAQMVCSRRRPDRVGRLGRSMGQGNGEGRACGSVEAGRHTLGMDGSVEAVRHTSRIELGQTDRSLELDRHCARQQHSITCVAQPTPAPGRGGAAGRQPACALSRISAARNVCRRRRGRRRAALAAGGGRLLWRHDVWTCTGRRLAPGAAEAAAPRRRLLMHAPQLAALFQQHRHLLGRQRPPAVNGLRVEPQSGGVCGEWVGAGLGCGPCPKG